MNTTTTVWTEDTIADYLSRPGYRTETPKETQKWLDFYRELDHLVSDSVTR